MRERQKATGWKIPILFCAAIAAIVALARFFIGSPGDLAIPEDLAARAKAIHIDLEGLDKGEWKERVVEAASGFSDPSLKDGKLGAISEEALAKKKFEAACVASVMIKNPDGRDAVMSKIFAESLKDCGTMPYAVFSLRGMADRKKAISMLPILENGWEKCRKPQ